MNLSADMVEFNPNPHTHPCPSIFVGTIICYPYINFNGDNLRFLEQNQTGRKRTCRLPRKTALTQIGTDIQIFLWGISVLTSRPENKETRQQQLQQHFHRIAKKKIEKAWGRQILCNFHASRKSSVEKVSFFLFFFYVSRTSSLLTGLVSRVTAGRRRWCRSRCGRWQLSARGWICLSINSVCLSTVGKRWKGQLHAILVKGENLQRITIKAV